MGGSAEHLMPRAELEVAYFACSNLEAFVTNSHMSFSYLLFIDDFGVHRNMYRALKAFFLDPCMSQLRRTLKIGQCLRASVRVSCAKFDHVVEASVDPVTGNIMFSRPGDKDSGDDSRDELDALLQQDTSIHPTRRRRTLFVPHGKSCLSTETEAI